MRTIRFGILSIIPVAGFAFSVVAYRYLHEQNIVDECLSGKHGSFDYSTMSCDLENNHAYVSYEKRHPHDKPVGLTSGGFIVILLPIYFLLGSADGKVARTDAKTSHSH